MVILKVMSVVVPENFSMGVIPPSSTLSTLNCYTKAFSAQGNVVVIIASDQYIFACRSNVLAPSVRV